MYTHRTEVSAGVAPNQTVNDAPKLKPINSNVYTPPPPDGDAELCSGSIMFRLWTKGTGDRGSRTGPIASKKRYSELSVEMIVHDAPSLIWCRVASKRMACNKVQQTF